MPWRAFYEERSASPERYGWYGPTFNEEWQAQQLATQMEQARPSEKWEAKPYKEGE